MNDKKILQYWKEYNEFTDGDDILWNKLSLEGYVKLRRMEG